MSVGYDVDALTEGYVCPKPQAWHRVYQHLMRLWEGDKKEMAEPPRLLILAGWNLSTPLERQRVWRETIEWARDYGVPVEVVQLTEEEKYQG